MAAPLRRVTPGSTQCASVLLASLIEEGHLPQRGMNAIDLIGERLPEREQIDGLTLEGRLDALSGGQVRRAARRYRRSRCARSQAPASASNRAMRRACASQVFRMRSRRRASWRSRSAAS